MLLALELTQAMIQACEQASGAPCNAISSPGDEVAHRGWRAVPVVHGGRAQSLTWCTTPPHLILAFGLTQAIMQACEQASGAMLVDLV